jgi:hypothetical protein
VHRPLAEQGQDGGADIATSRPSRAACLAVMLAGVPRSTGGTAVVVSAAITVDLGAAASAASVLVHVIPFMVLTCKPIAYKTSRYIVSYRSVNPA